MSDISTFYGGSCFAIRGKDCAVIISDLRMGMQSFTISKEFSKIYSIKENVFLGLLPFIPDAHSFAKEIQKDLNLLEMKEKQKIELRRLTHFISYKLYERRFSPYFISPIICAYDKGPFIASMDQIGCVDMDLKFAASGTAEKNLLGVAESLYEENMEEERLFKKAVQIFLNAINRDALSGWGAECYIIKENEVIRRIIKGRQD